MFYSDKSYEENIRILIVKLLYLKKIVFESFLF